ncbi:tandem-95 repeat protein, partial [Terasakiella sp. A23]|uniref:tandem-95 repeat protein n=1 Tax=Terasakiella sp. FCG-A23 TaxID=3080561 RepID=UPI0029529747
NTLADDSATLAEDSSKTINVIDNDTIVDGGTVTGITQPTNGVALLNDDGTVTYTPADDYNGTDSFTYTVTDNDGETQIATVNLTVTPENDAPVIDSIDLADGTEYAEYTLTAADLLAAASDVDGDTLSITDVSSTDPDVSITDNGDGTWTIVSDEEGEQPINFSVSDGTTTTTATTTIDFADVNNTATDDTASTDQDQAVTLNIADLIANDNIIDGGTITGVSGAQNGTVSIDTENGTITFTPDAGYDGADASFVYTITDEDGQTTSATVDVDIADIDNTLADDSATLAEDSSKTINVIDNDTIVDGGTVTGITQPTNGVALLNDDGTVTYTPADDYNGTDSFTYTVTDNDGETQIATVNLTVTPENDAPVIDSIDLADGTEYAEYTLTAADLLAAASDVDGDTLSITDVSSTDPDVSITDNGDGTWTIVSDEEGEQPINFSVSDGTTTTTATTTIDFADVNNTATDDTASTDQDQAVTLNIADLIANDNIIDG